MSEEKAVKLVKIHFKIEVQNLEAIFLKVFLLFSFSLGHSLLTSMPFSPGDPSGPGSPGSPFCPYSKNHTVKTVFK